MDNSKYTPERMGRHSRPESSSLPYPKRQTCGLPSEFSGDQFLPSHRYWLAPPVQQLYGPVPPLQRPYGPEPPLQRPYGPEPPLQRPYGPEPPLQRPYGLESPLQLPYGPVPPLQTPYGPVPPLQRPYGLEPPLQRPYGPEPPLQRPYGLESPLQLPYGPVPPLQTPYGPVPPLQRPYGLEPPLQLPYGPVPPLQRPYGPVPPLQRPYGLATPLHPQRPVTCTPNPTEQGVIYKSPPPTPPPQSSSRAPPAQSPPCPPLTGTEMQGLFFLDILRKVQTAPLSPRECERDPLLVAMKAMNQEEQKRFLMDILILTNAGILSKAPGHCNWMDVHGFVAGAADKGFIQFMCLHEFKEVPNGDFLPTDGFDMNVKAYWKGSTMVSRHDNERMVQPFVHHILVEATKLAESETSKRSFAAVAEPIIMGNAENQVADEAVFEQINSIDNTTSNVVCISEGKCLRVLLELKGTHVFPYMFAAKAAEAAFSQLLQEVALAWHSKLWQGDLLCGLATLDCWYLFKVKSSSVNGKLQLELQANSCYKQKFDESNYIENAKKLAHFLKDILIM